MVFFSGSGDGQDASTRATEGKKLSFTLFGVELVCCGVDVAFDELMTSVALSGSGIALGHVFDLSTNDLEFGLEGSDNPTRSRILGLGLAISRTSSMSSPTSLLPISGVFGAVAYSDRVETGL